ncbi:MAG: putative lipid II flippase FtsW [bacterium]|nr:putative lipid II flippase FtsW [bacterium]
MKKSLLIFLSTFCLATIGVIMVYSSSSVWSDYRFGDAFHYVKHQGLFFLVGLVGIFILSKIDYKIYYKYAGKILFLSFILLALVLIPGIGQVRNGSRSWFGIGAFGVQPSELSKIALIIFTSKYLSNHEKEVKFFKKGIFPILLIIFLFFGLIMLEPDFGTGMVIVMSLMFMLFITNAKLSFFGIMGVLGLGGIAGLIIIAPYRLARILSFLNPWSDPLGSGFQIIQSLYAIGPSGLFGTGFGNSIQKHFYLPEPQTDFIFAIISEEFGFIGILVIASLFLTLFYNTVKVSLECDDLFGKYLSFGLVISLILQAVLNICVVIGLVPVTGVTLPFLSYGGSSLLVSMASVGIILNIANKRKV